MDAKNIPAKVAVVLVMLVAPMAQGTVWYVTPTGTGAGTSWGDAGALQAVVNIAMPDDEVWVAAGTYTGTGNPVLTMKESVSLYGGFAGGETSREQRDWNANPTIIHGENVRRGVHGANNAVLDGFVITRGRAQAGSPWFPGPEADGAGMYNNGVSPVVANCVFRDNVADRQGGAMHNTGSTGAMEIRDCTFYRNRAPNGAGIYNSNAAPVIRRTLFVENQMAGGGGGMWNYGQDATPALYNCLFYGNRANTGAGMYNNNNAAPTIINSTFYGNAAGSGGSIFSESGSAPTVVNSIFWGNWMSDELDAEIAGGSPSVSYSAIERSSVFPGPGNINADPNFADVLFGDLRLLPDSPCINAGDAAAAPAEDIRGVTRPQGSGVDMGAWEMTAEDFLPPGAGGCTLVNAIAITPAQEGPTNAASIAFQIVFDTDVVNFNDDADLIINHHGTTHGSVDISGSGSAYTVIIDNIGGNGAFIVAVNTESDVEDGEGNPLTGSVASPPVRIDNIPPSVLLWSEADSTVNAAITVEAVLTEPDTNFDADAVTVDNAVISDFAGNGAHYVFVLTPLADGPFSCIVEPDKFSDIAGNANVVSNVLSRIFDGTGPLFYNVTASPAAAMPGQTVEIRFLCSEYLAGDPDVTVDGNPAVRALKSAGYIYAYTVPLNAPVGPAEIVISGVDLTGNAGSVTNTVALAIVHDDAASPLAAWPALAALLVVGVCMARRRKR